MGAKASSEGRRKPLQNPHPEGAATRAPDAPIRGPAHRLPDGLVKDAREGTRGEYGQSVVDVASFGEGGYTPMQGMRLDPDMMSNTTRAQLFPDKQQAVLDRIRVLFLSNAWHRIKLVERHHADVCRNPRVSHVEPAECSTAAWERLERARVGEARMVGAETWTVDRCGAEEQRYRVHYFRSDKDAFWVRVLPTNASGAKDMVVDAVLSWMGGTS